MEYYTVMLDRERHRCDFNSFLVETMYKITQSKINENVTVKSGQNPSDFMLWLAPNHRLLDLEVVEPDDLLVLGTQEQFEAASRFGSCRRKH